jgi:hypothetical protein
VLEHSGGLGSVLACPLAYPLAGAPGTVIGAECESLGASELARHFLPGKSGERRAATIEGCEGKREGERWELLLRWVMSGMPCPALRNSAKLLVDEREEWLIVGERR